jgi:L-alanine-DL-glutamate epimerase-like enolase superfamily enzyme
MATASNFNILELSYGENPWRAELISPAEDISHGDLRLSNRSGHGILLNEKTAAKYAAA